MSLLLVLSTFSLISVFAADPDESVTSSDAEYAWVDVAMTAKITTTGDAWKSKQNFYDSVPSLADDTARYNLIDFDRNKMPASGESSTFTAAKAGEGFVFELKEAAAVDKIEFTYDLKDKTVVLSASNDGASYTTLGEFSWTNGTDTNNGHQTSGNYDQFVIVREGFNTAKTAYKYYMLKLKDDTTSQFALYNVELYASYCVKPDGWEMVEALSNLDEKSALTTNGTIISPHLLRDTRLGAGTAGVSKIDSDTTKAYLLYDLGRVVPVSKLDFYIYTKGAPFTISASKDGVSWDILYVAYNANGGQIANGTGKEQIYDNGSASSSVAVGTKTVFDDCDPIYLNNEEYRYFKFERPGAQQQICVTAFKVYTSRQPSTYWQAQYNANSSRQYDPIGTPANKEAAEALFTYTQKRIGVHDYSETAAFTSDSTWRIFDGDTSKAGTFGNTNCLDIDLLKLHRLSGLKVQYNMKSVANAAGWFYVLGSADGANFDLLYTSEKYTADTNTCVGELYFEPAEYRYIRVYLPRAGGASSIQINELDLYGLEEAPTKLGVSNSAVAENTWTYKFENNSTAKVDYYEIIAEYSDAAKTAMTSVTAIKKEAPADKVTKGNVDLTGKTYVKCFVWDSTTLKPYSAVTIAPAE